MKKSDKQPLILIIDDVELNHRIVKDVLQSLDYRIEGAYDADQAFSLIDKELPDLILLDIVMPKVDGHEVCMKLKESTRTKDIPIIFLTAKTDDNDILWGFQLGAVDYIKKPFNPQELLARVHTHVELKMTKDGQRDLIEDLTSALAEVKQLSGLLPVCASCKSIRDDKGYWKKVEEYLISHTDVEVTHSLCPKCLKKLYPQYADKILEGK